YGLCPSLSLVLALLSHHPLFPTHRRRSLSDIKAAITPAATSVPPCPLFSPYHHPQPNTPPPPSRHRWRRCLFRTSKQPSPQLPLLYFRALSVVLTLLPSPPLPPRTQVAEVSLSDIKAAITPPRARVHASCPCFPPPQPTHRTQVAEVSLSDIKAAITPAATTDPLFTPGALRAFTPSEPSFHSSLCCCARVGRLYPRSPLLLPYYQPPPFPTPHTQVAEVDLSAIKAAITPACTSAPVFALDALRALDVKLRDYAAQRYALCALCALCAPPVHVHSALCALSVPSLPSVPSPCPLCPLCALSVPSVLSVPSLCPLCALSVPSLCPLCSLCHLCPLCPLRGALDVKLRDYAAERYARSLLHASKPPLHVPVRCGAVQCSAVLCGAVLCCAVLCCCAVRCGAACRAVLFGSRVAPLPGGIEACVDGFQRELQAHPQRAGAQPGFNNRRKNDESQSVEEYYERQHGITLRFPHLPCISASNRPNRPCWVPLELCSVVDAQRYLRQLTPQQVAAIGNLRLKPDKRRTDIANVGVSLPLCPLPRAPCRLPCHGMLTWHYMAWYGYLACMAWHDDIA
ncbi:unnamed protein product, partial [Closterium sp. NIES-54]